MKEGTKFNIGWAIILTLMAIYNGYVGHDYVFSAFVYLGIPIIAIALRYIYIWYKYREWFFNSKDTKTEGSDTSEESERSKGSE